MTDTYQPKCYAWMPGNSDVICSITPPDHEGDHRGYGGETWPRRTANVPQKALEALNRLEPQLNRLLNQLRMEAVYDGRHDVADRFSRAFDEYSRGLRIVRRVAVEWKREMEGRQ